MIVDSSALMAILLKEEDAERYWDALAESKTNRISAGTYIECAVVLASAKNPVVGTRFDELLRSFQIEVMPVTTMQAFRGREAFVNFGRGSGHKAHLNYGDCFSYALARELDEELLFKGNDFVHTDVRPAVR
jgi:ribonuclease VapC